MNSKLSELKGICKTCAYKDTCPYAKIMRETGYWISRCKDYKFFASESPRQCLGPEVGPRGRGWNMPTKKILAVPPPIPKEIIEKTGTKAKIVEARIARNLYTSLGNVKVALALTVEIHGDQYSHLFSLDRDLITGSVGRLLGSIGIEEFDPDDPKTEELVKKLEGKEVIIMNKGNKLYWYPR